MYQELLSFFKTKPSVGSPSVASVPLKMILEAYRDNVVLDYAKNRGTQEGKLVVNGNVLNSMKNEGIDSVKIGTIALSLEDGAFRIADGHSRINAAIKKYKENPELEEQELKNVIVRVELVHQQDHLKKYQYANQAKQHSGRQKTLNTDFTSGATVQKFLNKAGLELEDNLWQPLFSILYTANTLYNRTKDSVHINMNDVKQMTPSAEKYKDIPASEIGKNGLILNRLTVEKVGAALEYYRDIRYTATELEEKGDISGATLQSISTVGLMTFLMIDHLSDQRVTRQDLKKLLLKIDKHFLQCKNLFSEVARRNKGPAAVDQLKTMLASRTR